MPIFLKIKTIFILVAWLFIAAFTLCHLYQWHSQPTFSTPDDIDIIQYGHACVTTKMEDCTPAFVVQGKISQSMVEAVELQLAHYSNKIPYCFLSKGGDIEATQALLQHIYTHNATVCVANTYRVNNQPLSLTHIDIDGVTLDGGLCLSACTLLYGAAPHRLMVGEPYIGIHNGQRILDFCFCTVSLGQPDEPAILDDLTDTLENVTDPEKRQGLIDMIYSAATIPNNQMYFLRPDDIARFGLDE